MSEKIFEKLGRELDNVLEEGENFIKELDKALSETIERETSEKKMAERKEKFETFVTELDKEFNDFINSLQKDIKVSKIKIFNIRMKDFEKAIIKYNKKAKKITIGKVGSDKTFDIKLTKDISKKKIKKILNSVKYNKDTEIINITVKKKYLRED